MGQWIKRTVPPRILDMPTPRQLEIERAMVGWVWETGQGEHMTLTRRSRLEAVWTDQQGKEIVITESQDGTGTRLEA